MTIFGLLRTEFFPSIVCLFLSRTVCDVLHSICSVERWCGIPLAEILVLRAA